MSLMVARTSLFGSYGRKMRSYATWSVGHGPSVSLVGCILPRPTGTSTGSSEDFNTVLESSPDRK